MIRTPLYIYINEETAYKESVVHLPLSVFSVLYSIVLAGRDNLPNQKGGLNMQAMRHGRCACKESLKLDYSAVPNGSLTVVCGNHLGSNKTFL